MCFFHCINQWLKIKYQVHTFFHFGGCPNLKKYLVFVLFFRHWLMQWKKHYLLIHHFLKREFVIFLNGNVKEIFLVLWNAKHDYTAKCDEHCKARLILAHHPVCNDSGCDISSTLKPESDNFTLIYRVKGLEGDYNYGAPFKNCLQNDTGGFHLHLLV